MDRPRWTDPGTSAHPPTHPCGARSVLWPSLVEGWAPRAVGARFDLISQKVSQNGEVSPKVSEKASRSPYIPKRVPEVTSSISQISIIRSLLSQGINGPVLGLTLTLCSK